MKNTLISQSSHQCYTSNMTFFADNFFVDNVLYYVFTEQIGIAMQELAEGGISWNSAGITAANIVVFAII